VQSQLRTIRLTSKGLFCISPRPLEA
jgi:hypothetical protein